MSHPTDEELVDVAVGDRASGVVAHVAHVAECPTCSATVDALRRPARLLAGPLPDAVWQAPADEVWDRIQAEVDADDDTRPTAYGADDTDAPAVAPLPEAPAQQDDPRGDVVPLRPGPTDDAPVRRPRLLAWGSALVAASLAVGLLVGWTIWRPEGGATSIAQTELRTLDTKQSEGRASVIETGDGLDLRISTDRALDAGDGYLEVWLLNADGKRMVSVGVLDQGDSATFPIAPSLLDAGYVVVDISKEQFDDKPTHSGDSLLRGQLPA